ncbi:MAG: preprotein translocase subunit YajC [Actinobacteria bacterium]|jgi:preprotein translocase subunit YajC|nr:preprotein translocase subunit YajC [Actinomycetota bacterium]MBT3687545.1 preprotein translocase subunit YajC [Actinomycetota bacterium]MBT4037724.1 preprotein translocase subunit YajC [Actinomycetota bacterium]MBT4278791.1 preprotein translocase subunit YajC [Actinomycetota bacterium]MBT4343191.1 preprotein translocase subunit YajC [Actinomycetota bacterium]|tara:strand:- start:768 stop:1082 length:315 start_codon:yes stop_codon:yes gene_type:complete
MASFLPLILIFGLMYFLMIRPQQKKARAQQNLIASVQAGDEVRLHSGLFGVINEVEGDIVWLEVAENIELKVLRSAVEHRFNEPVVEEAEEEAVEEADEGPISD